MAATRSALILATDAYADPGLAALRSPEPDVVALADVLGDPGIGGFSVESVVNQPARAIVRMLEGFFRAAGPEDLLLLYVSCHGVSHAGEVYFAATDTRLGHLETSAVSSSFVSTEMGHSRAGRVVLLLDCGYLPGATRMPGVRNHGAPDFGMMLGGRSRAVIAVSPALEFAFEDDTPSQDDWAAKPSEFTSALVNGLRSGEADHDLDGMVSLDELYAYVHDEVTRLHPHSHATMFAGDMRHLYIARSGAVGRTPNWEPPAAESLPAPARLPTSPPAGDTSKLTLPRSRPGRYSRRGTAHRTKAHGPVESRPPPILAASTQSAIATAVSTNVSQGRLLFDPPQQMRQGRRERVTVAIAQTTGLDEQLRSIVGAAASARIEDVETSPFMEVELRGEFFDITPLQVGAARDQLLRPMALWQFDVIPQRSGVRGLQLCVAMRIPLPDRPDERVTVPVLERRILVRVDARYSAARFVRTHWQWLAATAAGLGGAITTWTKLIQG